MTSYIKDILEKDLVLKNLPNYPLKTQIEILDKISPENFSDMIYVSNFYLSNPSTSNLFLEKIKKIYNWKVYFDQNAPTTFIETFFNLANFSLTDTNLVLYYLRHYKLSTYIFQKHFEKIYQYALQEYDNNRKKFKDESTLFYAIFVALTKSEIIEIFDFLMDNIERIGNLDNSYTDVLLQLIDYLKTIDIEFHVYDTPILPKDRLQRLSKVI